MMSIIDWRLHLPSSAKHQTSRTPVQLGKILFLYEILKVVMFMLRMLPTQIIFCGRDLRIIDPIDFDIAEN